MVIKEYFIHLRLSDGGFTPQRIRSPTDGALNGILSFEFRVFLLLYWSSCNAYRKINKYDHRHVIFFYSYFIIAGFLNNYIIFKSNLLCLIELNISQRH